MPSTSDEIRTVGCSLQKLVPDAGQLDAIRQAVASTHKATILATELLNMHLRRMLTIPDAGRDRTKCLQPRRRDTLGENYSPVVLKTAGRGACMIGWHT